MIGRPAERGSSMIRDRVTVSAIFIIHGMVSGTLATRIPFIQERVHADIGGLGIALLAPSAGAVVVMPFAGALYRRMGARSFTGLAMAMWAAALALPALATNLVVLCGLLAVYGVAAGLSDIAINAQGAAVEQAVGRPIMPGLHGLWYVGALLASGVGALAVGQDIDGRVHLGGMAVVLLVALWPVWRRLPLPVPDRLPDEPASRRLSWPTRAILGVGLLGFCAVFADATSTNLSVMYMVKVMGANPALAAVTFTIYSCALAGARILGNGVVRRMGAVNAVRAGSVIATVGGIVLVVSRTPVLGIGGFVLLGIGIAVTLPVVFATVGAPGPHAGAAVARVATLTYGAGLAAPAAIGGLAQVTSMPLSFALVVLAAAAAFFLAPQLDRYQETTRNQEVNERRSGEVPAERPES